MKIFYTLCLLAGAISFSPVYADGDGNKTKYDIDSLASQALAAAAEMSVERAKQITGLYISNTVREELCGYDKWDSTLYMNRKLHVYFPETCKSVRYKWSQNVNFDTNLVRSIKYDILDNMTHIIFSRFYKKTISEYVKAINVEDLDKKYGENPTVAIKDKYNHLLYKTKKIYREYYDKENVELNKFLVNVEAKTALLTKANGNAKATAWINDIFSLTEVTAQSRLIDVLIASAYYKLINVESIKYPKLIIPNDILNFVKKVTSVKDSFADVVREAENRSGYYNKFILYYQFLSSSEKNIFSEGVVERAYPDISDSEKVKHIDNLIRVITMYVQILENPSKEHIKPILDSYASDIHSREVRYWERVWSVGTLAGFSAGSSRDGTSNGANAFIPFGILSTHGQSKSFMLHFFDLGQYVDYSDQDSSVVWQDALLPGVSWIFARYRRYPLIFGVDVSYIPESSIDKLGDDVRYSIFFSMELPIWELN